MHANKLFTDVNKNTITTRYSMIFYTDIGLSGSVPSNRKLLGLIAASVQSVQVKKNSMNFIMTC